VLNTPYRKSTQTARLPGGLFLFYSDLTGFIVTFARQTSMNAKGVRQLWFCENLSGLKGET